MKYLPEQFNANARWAGDMRAAGPSFFTGLAALQSPACLWTGCPDSPVPPGRIAGLKPSSGPWRPHGRAMRRHPAGSNFATEPLTPSREHKHG